MMRVKDHPDVDDERFVFVTDFEASLGLLDAAELLMLAGEDEAAKEMRALARRIGDQETAMRHDPAIAPGTLVCTTLPPDDAASMLRLLELLQSAESRVMSGDFRLLPVHIPRWSRDLPGFGYDEGGEPRRVSLWDEYQRVYKTLALLQTAGDHQKSVEICAERWEDDERDP
jgi:hypothetical protein